jgi:hypothetical protein
MGLCPDCPYRGECPHFNQATFGTEFSALEQMSSEIAESNNINFVPDYDITVDSCPKYDSLKKVIPKKPLIDYIKTKITPEDFLEEYGNEVKGIFNYKNLRCYGGNAIPMAIGEVVDNRKLAIDHWTDDEFEMVSNKII